MTSIHSSITSLRKAMMTPSTLRNTQSSATRPTHLIRRPQSNINFIRSIQNTIKIVPPTTRLANIQFYLLQNELFHGQHSTIHGCRCEVLQLTGLSQTSPHIKMVSECVIVINICVWVSQTSVTSKHTSNLSRKNTNTMILSMC